MDIGMTLFGQTLSFAILIWVTVKFIWPPLIDGDRGTPAEDRRRPGRGRQRSKKDLAQAEEKVNEGCAKRAQGDGDHRPGGGASAQIIDQAKDEAIEEGNRQKAAGRGRDRQAIAQGPRGPAQAGVRAGRRRRRAS